MRAKSVALALAILFAPSASALSAFGGSLELGIDAPLLSPVAVTQPLGPEPPRRADLPEPDLKDRPQRGEVREVVESVHVEHKVTPPKVQTANAPWAKIERLDRGIAEPEGRAAPPLAPGRLAQAPLPEGALSLGTPAPRAPEAPALHAPEPAPARAAEAETPAPEARAPGPDAPAIATIAFALVLAAFALYHRLTSSEVRQQGKRARLMELLRDRPGLSAAELARALEVDPSTATYHLRLLAREQLVSAEGVGRSARYFAAGTVAHAERGRVVVEKEAGVVLHAVRADPGVHKSLLARRLAIARSTVGWHLARLQDAGLVRTQRHGRNVCVFPQETFS